MEKQLTQNHKRLCKQKYETMEYECDTLKCTHRKSISECNTLRKQYTNALRARDEWRQYAQAREKENQILQKQITRMAQENQRLKESNQSAHHNPKMICSSCREHKSVDAFSKTQRKKKSNRRCKTCIERCRVNSARIIERQYYNSNYYPLPTHMIANKPEKQKAQPPQKVSDVDMISKSLLVTPLRAMFNINTQFAEQLSSTILSFLPFEHAAKYEWNGDNIPYQSWDKHTIQLRADYTYYWKYYMKDKCPGYTQHEEWEWNGSFHIENNQIILQVKDQQIYWKKPVPSFSIGATLSKYTDGYSLKLEDEIPLKGEIANGVRLKRIFTLDDNTASTSLTLKRRAKRAKLLQDVKNQLSKSEYNTFKLVLKSLQSMKHSKDERVFDQNVVVPFRTLFGTSKRQHLILDLTKYIPRQFVKYYTLKLVQPEPVRCEEHHTLDDSFVK
eukprot:128359_1